ncbi:tyrosine-type recombinase/integrase [Malikia spinosa]|uniref:tyrosine-type recombinase/integrase n=1 Tax=Malikia spinosa TaxID=86180 RepID=UPI0027BAB260|nr:tyrosine-type recombinase/integrase [Malikia spinosa]
MRAPMPRLVKDGKSGIWFFRWSLPKSHQQNLNQKTLYITLRTRDARLAQSHAALLNLRVEAMKKIPNLNEDAIRKLLEIDMERGIFRADTPEEQERGLQILENLGRIRASTPQQNNAPALRRAPAMTPTSPLFRAVADELIREISLTLKKASVDKYRSTYDAFREHTGNRFVEDITRAEIKHFKDHLLSNGMVAHTINGHLGRLHALFEFALKNGYIKGENPAANHLIPHSKKAIKSRDKFYDDDLKAIYNWETYGPMAITPDYFWGPLVCLFSGMRIEECTSLEVKNIKTDDGVLLMHIKDAKTPTGIRFVPVHSFLIKLGFLDYVEEVRKLGHEGLFWYLSEGAMGKLTNHNGTKKNLSRHFSKYLDKVQVKEDDNCFHSLRHTTITRFVARKVNNSTIYKLSGHTSDNSTHFDYLHDLPVKALQEAVEALDFHELLDLSSFDWKPSLEKVLAREAKRAQTAEGKRLRAERLAHKAMPPKKRPTKF